MSKSDAKQILIISCAIFLMLGTFTAAVGPILPEFSANTHASLTAVGGVITAIFLGALLAQITGGLLIDRLGYKKILILSLCVMAAGVTAMTLTRQLWLVLVMTFMAGLGHGSIDICMNVLISQVYNHRQVSALNLLNFFFGLGAFIGPSIVSLALKLTGSGVPVLWLVSLTLLLAIPFALRMQKPSSANPNGEQPPVLPLAVYRSRLIWMLGFMLLLYVGVENGVGGWVTTYIHLTTDFSLENAALVSSGFWGAFTIGRLLGTLLGSHWSPLRLLGTSLGLSTVSGLLFTLSSGNPLLSILAIAGMGLGFGPVYPTIMAVVTAHYQEQPGAAVSLGAAMGSLGGMLIPFLQGFVMDHSSPSASTLVITASIALILCLLMILRKPVAQVAQGDGGN